jgi:predicted nucleic acid-binding protein
VPSARARAILHPASLYNERALELALALGHPIYGCLYLACAEALGATLVTADGWFRAAAGRSGFAGLIRDLRS